MPGKWWSDTKERLRGFINKKGYKEPLIFIVCLIISFVFWSLTVMYETAEYEFKVPVKIINVPKNEVVMGLIDTVKVTVKDRGFAVYSLMMRKQLGTVIVNYTTTSKGNDIGHLTASEMLKQVKKMLGAIGSGGQISISPSELSYRYSLGDEKNIPVKIKGEILPEESHYITKIIIEPDSVVVFAPIEGIDNITEANTVELDIKDVIDTLITEARLAPGQNMRFTPEKVKLTIFTDILTEEYMVVPIRCTNTPEGKILKTFPSKVKVKLTTGAKYFKKLSPSNFDIVVDYNDIKNKPERKCKVKIFSLPDGINRAELQQDSVDYLIETIDTVAPTLNHIPVKK